jgi:hypothetical protein
MACACRENECKSCHVVVLHTAAVICNTCPLLFVFCCHMMCAFVTAAAALCSYRLASIRCVPQLPAGSVDFTTFTWTALLRRLKAMGVSGDRIAS